MSSASLKLKASHCSKTTRSRPHAVRFEILWPTCQPGVLDADCHERPGRNANPIGDVKGTPP